MPVDETEIAPDERDFPNLRTVICLGALSALCLIAVLVSIAVRILL